MDIPVMDDESTVTMLEDVFPENEPDNLVSSHSFSIFPCCTNLLNEMPSSACDVQMPEDAEDSTIEGNVQQVLISLETTFSKLTLASGLEDLVELHSRHRVVVSVEKLIELNGTHCKSIFNGCACGKQFKYGVKYVGTRVDLDWKCVNGHCGKWESSEVLAVNRYSKVYANDSLLSIAIVLSGNNYSKFELLCKALNLCLMSKTNFCHFQAKCALPAVKSTWSSMRSGIINILNKYKEICLSGDGRNDSRGHSARYCVYSLMEHCTKVIVDLEIIDKRETGGNSTIMEREGLRRLLKRLMNEITVSELCTDASSTIIKLVRDMKGRTIKMLIRFTENNLSTEIKLERRIRSVESDKMFYPSVHLSYRL